MLSLITIIGMAFLSVALLAFGWYPCCCGVTSACCPGLVLPTTLYMTITQLQGTCTLLGSTDTYELTYDASAPFSPEGFEWNGTYDIGSCTFQMFINCNPFGATGWSFGVRTSSTFSLPDCCLAASGTQLASIVAGESPATCGTPFAKSGTATFTTTTGGDCCTVDELNEWQFDVTT